MVGNFILYLALIQLGATAAITAIVVGALYLICLLYTSDAADE